MNTFEINHQYSILHFDEYPILFIGFNYRYQNIVGSFLYEDDNDNLLYLYSIVPFKVFSEFISRKISYLELLKKVNNFFIVTKDYNDKIIKVDSVRFDQVDPEILPLPSAYCPEVNESTLEKFKTPTINIWVWDHNKKKSTKDKTNNNFEYIEYNFKYSHKKSPREGDYGDVYIGVDEYHLNQRGINPFKSNAKTKSRHSLENV